MNLIQKLEQEEIARLGRKIPDFGPGDTVIVRVTVVEGDKKREQAHEGAVIARRNRALNPSFTVPKISSGGGAQPASHPFPPPTPSVERKGTRDARRPPRY